VRVEACPIRRPLAILAGILCLSAALAAQQPAVGQAAGPILKTLRIEGASIYTAQELASRAGVAEGSPLTRTPDDIARDIQRRYHDDGYKLATVEAALDEASRTLTIRVDEGRFDAVDVSGVPDGARRQILDSVALVPGEVFNESQANRALDAALEFARGAIDRAEPPFTIISDAGRRVLRIGLRTRGNQVGVFLGTQGREDWYSPVDALNFGLGFHGTVFDRTRFNHLYWFGYFTRKTGPDRTGYTLGIERPFLRGDLLQVGGTIYDLTASDDQWRLGNVEQSLVALGFRNTFRDYYRRKGYQVHAAVRPRDAHEVVVDWRDDDHRALVNETDYGFFRDSHPFRPNAVAQPGDLRSLILAYTFDSRGLDQQPSARFHQHLLDNLFADATGRDHGFRFDWRSELAPGSFSHDFDFSRHVATARGWWQPTKRRIVSGRFVAGTSTGALPAQRAFALGGIGTVHGYRFKEAAGERMVLMNAEIRQGFWGSGVAGLAFFDAGRVYRPRPGSSESWLTGVGVGLEFGDGGARLEFGWRVDDVPDSLQVLFRLRPTF
jgi:hypothetical protein